MSHLQPERLDLGPSDTYGRWKLGTYMPGVDL